MPQLSVEAVRQLRARGWAVTFAAREIRLRNGHHQITLVDPNRVLLEDTRHSEVGFSGPLRRFDPIWQMALDLLRVDTDVAIFSPPLARWLYPVRTRVAGRGVLERRR
jgi:hypothetical protein